MDVKKDINYLQIIISEGIPFFVAFQSRFVTIGTGLNILLPYMMTADICSRLFRHYKCPHLFAFTSVMDNNGKYARKIRKDGLLGEKVPRSKNTSIIKMDYINT